MAIYSQDIRTQLPAVPGQFPESGGRPGPDELVHNEVGLLFPKLTEIAHAGGQVDLSKLYQWVKSPNTDLAARSFTFIDRPPQDPLVSCALFRANPIGTRADHTNTRADLRDYVESYQVSAGLSPWYLRGLHPAGISTVYLWSHLQARLPEVGQVLYLVSGEGGGGEYSQYVQIAGMSHQIETYQEVVSGTLTTFQRRLIECSLTQALGASFSGPEVTYIPPTSPTVKVRECVVAEAARYYGISALTAGVTAGDQVLDVASVYSRIVPVARGEQGVVDVPALTAGAITATSGGQSFSLYGPVHTHAEAVTAETQRLTWTHTMAPIPATGGKVHVHVRILDVWYTVIEGESSPVGVVTCNRYTGSGSLVLVDLPDVGSYVLWEWPAMVHYTDRAGHLDIEPVRMRGALTTPLEPGSFAVSWYSATVQKTATAGTDGQVTGDCTGYVLPSGEWWLEFAANLPDGNSQLTIDWDEASTSQETFLGLTPSGGAVPFTLASLPVPGSVLFEWETQRQTERVSGYETPGVESRACSGLGGCMMRASVPPASAEWGSSQKRTIEWASSDDGAGAIHSGGTISYATGAVSLDVVGSYDFKSWSEGTTSWSTDSGTETFRGRVVATYQIAGGGQSHQLAIDVEPLRIELLPGLQDSLVPGTVRLTFGGVAISDRDGGGTLYLADGTVVGSINYVDAEVTLTDWTGTSVAVVLTSAISTFGTWTTSAVAFRTAGAPLAPGSLQVNATEDDGDAILGDCDTEGVITGTGIDSGSCEQDIGFVSLAFTNQVWSDLTYNGSIYTIVPLDPAIIGVDPVRLPPDGRVVTLRSGDYLCLFHDTATNAPNPTDPDDVINLGETNIAYAYIADGAGEEVVSLPGGIIGGQVVDLHGLFTGDAASRTGPLEYAVLEDAEGKHVAGGLYAVDLTTWECTFADPLSLADYEQPLACRLQVLVGPDDYDVDLGAGTVTMATAWDKTGLTEPLVIHWRYQDIVVCSRAETTGRLSLLTPLAHDYSSGDKVASCLQHGDLQARVVNVFSENTVPANWADYRQGSAPSGGGNFDAEYITTRNDGAIRERWRIKRRSDTQWDVIGETRGVIGIWDGVSDYECFEYGWQIQPYFTIHVAGLGAGWATGNFFQFETHAAQAPFAALRCVAPGAATIALDSIRIAHRLGGD